MQLQKEQVERDFLKRKPLLFGPEPSRPTGAALPHTCLTEIISPSPKTQQYSRGNNTIQANSLKDLLQNKIDDMEKQVLSRVNTLEDTKPAPRNDTDQRNKVESTLTTLHHRITDLEKGASPHTHTHTHTHHVCWEGKRRRWWTFVWVDGIVFLLFWSDCG